MVGRTRISARGAGMTKDEKFVIFASSLGTVFEWYDFYLYATLAPFFAALFFPPGNDTAALLSAFATYAAGFLVRPFGALVFGRIGDLVGRKYTFLVTIFVMGAATFMVGLLPTFDTIGWAAPLLLVALRLVQGLALGGEYGGAATYVAEHARPQNRGFATSFIQITATLGFFLALLVIGACRIYMDADTFASWGWRIPFVVSLLLLVLSIWIRLRLNETPIFQRMKEEGKGSKAPLTESFFRYPNNKYVLLALLGATAGQGVVWYTGQFYALFFLQITLQLDYLLAYLLVGVSLLIGTPLFIAFGWLSDRIGRLKIILLGCLLAAATYMPLFQVLTRAVNPDLVAFQERSAVSVSADRATCRVHVFVGPWSDFSDCDRAQDFVTKLGVSFHKVDVPGGPVTLTIGETTVAGWSQARWQAAFEGAGYPTYADPSKVDWVTAELVLLVMVLYVVMVYAPMAAFLVEMFPTRIRYTSMSLPYHIGNGWFGGMLPLLATAIVASTGDIYAGLWYPIGVAGMTVLIGAVFLRETKDVDIATGSGVEISRRG
ncbi:MFS transporter [Rhodoplanes sp. TEM]|uniref:MFS transporter n=1 Tax=Rhodoplanes tepidamans TaxID=200616 RepID=A0ABT5JH23_RHOTP|nr:MULTISPECIES: MFS transporter [Rhodoplanes]MDC7788877.1 MFS transporter [Rhodoplanes tepidamans]MDC7987514.1 MFS transporter [Rhodoplanes sp. TEM]MDQ0355113.1 MFS family permease [Rhodoplanes tepidamans]